MIEPDLSPQRIERAFSFSNFSEYRDRNFELFGTKSSILGDEAKFSVKVIQKSFSFIDVITARKTPYAAEIDNECLSRRNHPRRFTLCMATSGSDYLSQEDNAITLNPGELAILDTGLRSRHFALGPTVSTMLSIPSDVWSAYAAPPRSGLRMAVPPGGACYRVAKFLAMEIATSNDSLQADHHITLARQLVELLSLAYTEAPDTLPSTLHRQVRLRLIKAFVRDNYANPDLSPILIAERFGISVRYMSGLFRDEDQTAMQYLMNIRLQRAWELLLQRRATKRSIKEIAYTVGFTNISHFNKVFLQRFGITPNKAAV